MKEFELKYGCNPNQKPAKIYMADGADLPVTILNGRPGYINFLDALRPRACPAPPPLSTSPPPLRRWGCLCRRR